MARKVTVTKAETEALVWLRDRLTAWESEGHPLVKKHTVALNVLLEKLCAPQREKPKGISISEAETALLECRKYAPFVGGNPYPLLASLARLKVHPDQLRVVGLWINRQRWIIGTVTLGSILRNWTKWLAQAMADVDYRVTGVWSGRAQEDSGTDADY